MGSRGIEICAVLMTYLLQRFLWLKRGWRPWIGSPHPKRSCKTLHEQKNGDLDLRGRERTESEECHHSKRTVRTFTDIIRMVSRDLRNSKELELISLEIERMNYIVRDQGNVMLLMSESRSSPDYDIDSSGTSPRLGSTPKRSLTDPRVRGPVIHLRKSTSMMAIDLPFSIDYNSLKWLKMIGKGAYATVWSAEWLHMPVAVKVNYY